VDIPIQDDDYSYMPVNVILSGNTPLHCVVADALQASKALVYAFPGRFSVREGCQSRDSASRINSRKTSIYLRRYVENVVHCWCLVWASLDETRRQEDDWLCWTSLEAI
jgi:hypothetical protein